MANIIEEFYAGLEARQRMAGEAQRQRLAELVTQSNLDTAAQQRELTGFDIQRAQREFTPGSLEDVTRRVQTSQAQQSLEDVDLTNQSAQQQRMLDVRQKQSELAVKRIKSGEDGQRILDELEFVPKGTKYKEIEVSPGFKVPGMILPGQTQPEFLDEKDEEEALAHARRIQIERLSKESTSKLDKNKRPDKETIQNISNLATGDEDLRGLSEEELTSFSTLVANKAQANLDETNGQISWDDAVDAAYSSIKKLHIRPGKERTFWFDKSPEFSLTGIKSELKTNEVKRQTADGRIAIFDKASKKFIRYEK